VEHWKLGQTTTDFRGGAVMQEIADWLKKLFRKRHFVYPKMLANAEFC